MNTEQRRALKESMDLGRNAVIRRIRNALRARSGKPWSVKGGRGTTWGWITISSPPKRCEGHDYMPPQERDELARLLGLGRVHQQGQDVPNSNDYYVEFIDRAEGRAPRIVGEPYWD